MEAIDWPLVLIIFQLCFAIIGIYIDIKVLFILITTGIIHINTKVILCNILFTSIAICFTR